MKLSRRQLRRLIAEALLTEAAAALNDKLKAVLKAGLENVIEKNKGRSEPNIVLPYMAGRNNAAHNDVVEGLQAFLKDQGINTGIDGDWGAGTTKSLKAYQRDNLAKVDYEDGKLGPKTSNAILAAITKVEKPSYDASRIQGIRVEDSLFGFLTKDGPSIEEKENYLAMHTLDPKVRAAAQEYLDTEKMNKETEEMLKQIKYEADKKVVDDFMAGVDFDGTGSKKSKKEEFTSTAIIPRKFARALQTFYKNNPKSLKDTSQALSLGIADLSAEEVKKIDVDGVKLKGFGFGGKKRIYIPMADGKHYYEFLLNSRGKHTLDKEASNPLRLKDFLSESRRFGESRGTLYRRRYRRY